jgi:hypothetical protein
MPQRITLFRVRDEFRWFPAPEVFPHAHNNANAGISLFWGCAMLTLIQAKIERQRETRKQTRLLIFINHLNRTSGVCGMSDGVSAWSDVRRRPGNAQLRREVTLASEIKLLVI